MRKSSEPKQLSLQAKGQIPLVKGKRKPPMSHEREKGHGTKTDDPSKEEEEDAENDDDEEVGEEGDGEDEEDEGEAEDEGEEEDEGEAEEEVEDEEAEEGGTGNRNAAKDVTTERDAMENIENARDAEEQAEGNEDGEEVGEEMGTHGELREDREAVEQLVTANNRDGAWRDGGFAKTTDKEEEERDTCSGGEERMAGEENGDHEERRKWPLETCEVFDCPTPGDRPNKRSKGNDSESEDGVATDDLPKEKVNLETTPRPRKSSPTSTTASPGSILEIVRQTSAVPGLENTEEAVWDAARKDSVICSLALDQQAKMVRTALSLSSEERIKAHRHFVYNARRDGSRKVKILESDFDLSGPNSGVDVWHATDVLVLCGSGLAHFSALHRQIDFIDNKATLFSITKRVKLATMAQYRKSLLQEVAGKNQARDVNLYLFRGIYPDHDTIERPDNKGTKSGAHND